MKEKRVSYSAYIITYRGLENGANCYHYMQVNAYYDFEDVIDSDEELDLASMATDPWM